MPSIFAITVASEGGPEAGGGVGAGVGDGDGVELEGGGGAGGAAVVIAAVGLGDPPQPVKITTQEAHIRRERESRDLRNCTNDTP